MDKPTERQWEMALTVVDSAIVNIEDGEYDATRRERETLHDAYVILDRLARPARRDGGYVTSATLWVLAILLTLATVLAGYVGDQMGAARDAMSTATSDVGEGSDDG